MTAQELAIKIIEECDTKKPGSYDLYDTRYTYITIIENDWKPIDFPNIKTGFCLYDVVEVLINAIASQPGDFEVKRIYWNPEMEFIKIVKGYNFDLCKK